MSLPAALDSLLRSAPLRAVAEHWFANRGDALITPRASFDIFRFRALLPNTFLYDYEPEARTLKLRLAGEEIRTLLRNAQPGASLYDMMPKDLAANMEQKYRRVCEEPAFMHVIGRVFQGLGGTGVGERLIMPLGDDGGAARQLLGATLYRIGDTLEDGTPIPQGQQITTFVAAR